MIRFKIDVLQELKKKGYNTTRLRNEKIIAEGIITKIRTANKNNDNVNISTMTLNTLCYLLGKQPAQIIEYVKDETENK